METAQQLKTSPTQDLYNYTQVILEFCKLIYALPPMTLTRREVLVLSQYNTLPWVLTKLYILPEIQMTI